MDPVPQPPSPRRPLRRTPVQQRSAERLARILDACAELLEEAGYEQLSTRAVAVRAGVPIGSVYRFFGNKRAMADALAHRNLDRYAERIAARLAAAGQVDAYGTIDSVLDEYIAMKRTVPGFALVDFGVPAPATGESSGAKSGAKSRTGFGEESGGGSGDGSGVYANHLVADRLCELLATHLGRVADDALRRKVLVGVETADALLRLAFRTDPSGDPALIAETREILYAYLAPSLT
ncbi:TetR/AcrR family transcriptional regulator [Streptomyces vilmorinianum]|uniref:TetR/AcrR family transcriptional regulator n=1 Tax=Streptomyces vilmorinianum TaxID=3051092 RepID=UPI0010FACFAF|nr:TetR/AcrR family transcriptional regulator [Streptomyces vilmorinianum]